MAKRAGATITEVEGSHVIMISQPQAVTDVILDAVAGVDEGLRTAQTRDPHSGVSLGRRGGGDDRYRQP
jgi:hypothetical protein